MENECVSVIVPIYNVEQYLNACIESITRQSYENLQIILINDGSKDFSESICKEWQQRDQRIEVIFQKNQGVSVARNKGLASSRGKYVSFIDADDWIEKDYIKNFVNSFSENEKIFPFSGYIKEASDGEKIIHPLEFGASFLHESIVKEMLSNSGINGYLWNKFFIREIIANNDIHFEESLTIAEDLLFCVQYSCFVKEAVYIDNITYHYVERKNSASNEIQKGTKIEVLTHLKAIDQIDLIISNDYSDIKKKLKFDKIYWTAFYYRRMRYNNIKGTEVNSLLEFLKQNILYVLTERDFGVLEKLKIILTILFPKLLIKIK